MTLKKLILISVLFFSGFFLFSQELPRGFGNIILGSPLEATKEALQDHPEFGYHGDSDVSLLPGQNRYLIETDAEYGHGSNFLRRCYFHFFNDYLYIITINLNTDKLDYYSVFTKLCEKYGDPKDLNPQQAVWENMFTSVILEKPLSIKYIDNMKFKQTLGDSRVGPAPEEITKEMFLDEL